MDTDQARTDAAMLIAMAYVIIKENLQDQSTLIDA
jgi:anaerobic selenocysteine-containing dehydrogenase